jgi:hypothetical protein
MGYWKQRTRPQSVPSQRETGLEQKQAKLRNRAFLLAGKYWLRLLFRLFETSEPLAGMRQGVWTISSIATGQFSYQPRQRISNQTLNPLKISTSNIRKSKRISL